MPQRMGRKNDLVVWLKLQPQQRRIYEVCRNAFPTGHIFNPTVVWNSTVSVAACSVGKHSLLSL